MSLDLINIINDISTALLSGTTQKDGNCSCGDSLRITHTIHKVSFVIEPFNIVNKSLEFTVTLNSIPKALKGCIFIISFAKCSF